MKTENRGILFAAKAALMLYWLAWMRDSDAYYTVYLTVGAAGIAAWSVNFIKGRTNKEAPGRRAVCLLSALFAAAAAGANYAVILNMPCPEGTGAPVDVIYIAIVAIAVLLGGYWIAENCLLFLWEMLEKYQWKEQEYRCRPWVVVTVTMLLISAVNLWFLFSCCYPGTLTPDSIWQVGQCLSSSYSNHHPFYHTIIIKLFLSLGLWIFKDINKAVALYSVFQVIFMAGVFSYVIVTLYQMKIPRKWLFLCLAWYILVPYHIMYSFTMWKDVMFGGGTVLFITAAFRVLKKIGRIRAINYGMAFAGGMGICLFRSNGWLAFFLTFIVFLIMFGNKQKKLAGLSASVLLLSFLLLHPVLSYLGVARGDAIEALSVPAQQIARVLTDCGDISPKQSELLGEIVNTEEIPAVYQPGLSDPVKQKVREKGRQDYLTEHKLEYFMLWLEIGIAHPHKYVEAWIDQTKGYWNGGYDAGAWSLGVGENDLGIASNVRSWNARRVMNDYFWFYNNIPLLQIFLSIGFWVWVIVAAGALGGSILKRKEAAFLTVPLAAIIFTLLVATPVYAEFRYAYAVFASIPMVLPAAFYGKGHEKDHGISKIKEQKNPGLENGEEKELLQRKEI